MWSFGQADLTLLDLAVALQMISYVYLLLPFLRRAFSNSYPPCFFRRLVLADRLIRRAHRIIVRDGLVQNAAEQGAYMFEGLEQLAATRHLYRPVTVASSVTRK